MVWWLFKKRSDNRLDSEIIKNSFSNIKHDMNHISSWINHFKDKHETQDKKHELHESNYSELLSRIVKLEKSINKQETQELNFEDLESVEEMPLINNNELHLESLTDTERKICWVLSKLKKESPDGWISLKTLGTEMYPDKEYHKIRSAISQFISSLEEQGFVLRKRKRKQAFVFLKELKKEKKKAKIKAKN